MTAPVRADRDSTMKSASYLHGSLRMSAFTIMAVNARLLIL